jgi:hypothetical protein
MGDKIDIYKITLDFLKGNKVILLIVTALLGGGAVGHYLPPLIAAKPVEVTVKAATPVIIKENCGKCEKEITDLKEKIKRAKTEITKLKRWHQ